METKTVTREAMGIILKEAMQDMKEHIEELRELDAMLGDGDLGITVDMASDAVLQTLSIEVDDDVGGLLTRCGTSIRRASPSTYGTLLGSAFIEAGRAVDGKRELTVSDLSLIGHGAIAGIRKWGKAEAGDKTMLDALVPAVESFDAGVHRTESVFDLEPALQAAVDAARTGMEATVNMRAKHGRTSWHQEKSVGVRDAGATAMYYLVEAFARHMLPFSTCSE